MEKNSIFAMIEVKTMSIQKGRILVPPILR